MQTMTQDLVAVKLDKARLLLAEARTIQDTKRVVDLAHSAEVFAKRQKLGEEAERYAAEIKLDALRQLGAMLKATDRARGGDVGGRRALDGSRKEPSNAAPTLADMGLDKKTSALAQQVAALPAEQFERVKAGVVELSKARKEVAQMEREQARAELAAEHEPARFAGLELDTVRVCSIFDLSLPENCADMVFTDPPYHDEFLDLWARLGEVAAHALKPGAYLMTYTGKMYLPQVMAALTEKLEYVWTFCVFQPDGCQKVNKHHLFEAWRPVLCFRKPGPAIERAWEPDAIKGTRGKEWHEWQQQIEPPVKYIAAYTPPGGLVIDPFVGGGTTLEACKQVGRHYAGFDIDPQAVSLTMARLEQ